MGAKVGAPDREVWSVDGDGQFQMTNQDSPPASQRHPHQGRPHQQLLPRDGAPSGRPLYDGRYSHTELETGYGSRTCRLRQAADAYGAVGLRCESVKCVDETIAKAGRSTTSPW